MAGYDIKPSGWLSFDFRELIRFRELLYFMAWRDIKVKYKQTFLGILWVVLQPVALVLIFSTLWIKVMKANPADLPYPVFAYSGLLLWGLFSSAISNSGDSMISNSNIIKKVYFPRIIIPASSIIVALFDLLMTLIIYILMIFYYHLNINILNFIFLLTVSVLITTLTSFGIGLIIASATIKYRDFRYILPFFLQAFFFLSPVIYPISLISSARLKFILSLNPLSGAISLLRSALTNSPINSNLLFCSIIMTIILLIAGLVSFGRMESQYSDIL